MAAVYSVEECSLPQTDIEISCSGKQEDMAQKPGAGSGNSHQALLGETAAVELDVRPGGPAPEARQHEEDEAAVNAAVPLIRIKEEETEENEYITVSLNVAGEDSDEQTDGNASLLAVDDSTDVKLCSMRCQDCGRQFTSWEACKSHLLKHLEEEVELERERKKRAVLSTVGEDSGPQLEKKLRMDVKEEEIIGPVLEMDFKEEEIFDPQLEMDFKEEKISDLRLETKVRIAGKEEETSCPPLEKKTRMDGKENETSGPQLETKTRIDGKENKASGPRLEKKTRMDSKEEEIKLNSVDDEPLSESSCQIKPYEIFLVHHSAVQSEEGNSMSSLAKRVYVCSVCGKMYSFPASFRNHQKTHVNQKNIGEFSCKECGKSFARSAGLAVHMRYHRQANPDELPSLHCEQCNKDFRTTHTFMTHQKMHKQKPFWCHKCKKGFKCRETLDKHLLGHDAGKYRCLICQKAFQVVSELRDHLNIHRAPKPHRCDVCQRTFSHLGNLIIHSKKHLEMSKDGKKEARFAEGQIMKKRVVGGSDMTAFQVVSELRHRLDIRRAPKPHRCDVCQRTFSHLGNLIIHSKKHLKMSKDGKKEVRFAKGQIMKKRVVGGSDATTERVQDVGSEEDSTSSESSDSSASTDASDSSDSSSESSAGEQEAEPIVIGKVEGELEDGEVWEHKGSGSCMPFNYPLSCISEVSSCSPADELDDGSVPADKSVSSNCSSTSSSSTLSAGSPLCFPADELDVPMLAEESDSSDSSSDSSARVREEEPADIEEGEESDDSKSTTSIGMWNSSSSDSSAGELEEGEIKDIRGLESGVRWACYECGACFFHEPELHIHYMKHANGMT